MYLQDENAVLIIRFYTSMSFRPFSEHLAQYCATITDLVVP